MDSLPVLPEAEGRSVTSMALVRRRLQLGPEHVQLLQACHRQRGGVVTNSAPPAGHSLLPRGGDEFRSVATTPAAPAPAAHAAVLPSRPLPRPQRMTAKAAGVDAVFQSAMQDRIPLQKNFPSSRRCSFSRFAASRKQHASATRNSESAPAPLAACEKKPWGGARLRRVTVVLWSRRRG